MSELLRARMILAGCVTALTLAACGGGGGGDASPAPGVVGNTPPTAPPTAPPTQPVIPNPLTPVPPVTNNPPIPGAPNAPVATGNIALDGREWINYRRGLIGMSTLTHSSVIDIAAQGHSDYQRINNTITHVQTPGKQGFTGAELADRLQSAGYVFNVNASRAYGEVISATNNGSGQYMAEELITAIYHRFVIFEPVFKEIGTGAATTAQGYNYFTANFTANNGYGTGLPSGQVAVWPFNGMAAVPRNFYSDTESPDPVPDRNEVGYPISVHANIDKSVRVTSFTVRPRGGADLAVRLLTETNDTHTGGSSAAIVPLAPLAPNTVYEVNFSGTVSGVAVSRSWTFTTL
ncbi:CAP domain-containing protein [Massilia sp. Dwa41.01b]|uniref:CAP domain-containing protein n=1 Tax=unclassified Massilia TaxID=2609279 RepID=UPI001603F5EA|nr:MULTISPECIES: CAP domain-containing protein [unclassified Massilia]QNA87478.1 CAP domain-containing protein [Massilia sp. Dwa41.01b]QNA98383.1 CAP domain-containing protein [Massilia sp. Se16.2.3]